MRHDQCIRPLVLTAALSLACPVFGSTIVSITGNEGAFENGASSEWTAQSWTQAATYSDVTIKATVFQELIGTPNGDGFAFLEEKVGSHAVEIDSHDFKFPADSSEASPAQITLFSGLTLGPGTYYLAIYGQGFWTADFIGSGPTITSAPDVSDVTDTLVSHDSGHTFSDTNNGTYQHFRVTGTEAPPNGGSETPEPSTSLLVGGAFLFIGLVKRRRNSQRSSRSCSTEARAFRRCGSSALGTDIARHRAALFSSHRRAACGCRICE